MRVTKTIREFIEKEVNKRLEVKYAAEKAMAEFQKKVKNDVYREASAIVQKAYDEYMAEVFAKYDFLVDRHKDLERPCVEIKTYMAFDFKDPHIGPQSWARRMNDEAKDIIDGIIVELELGGDKATLMTMLNKVGEA